MNQAEVTDLLARALAAVEGAKVPEDLREVAFTAALGMLTNSQPAVTPFSAESSPSSPAARGAADTAPTGSTLLEKIASGLEVEPTNAKRLFAEQDGEPVLILKASKLPKTISAAACDIALLVMAGRQLGGIDDYTESDVLREATRRYGKFDSRNFATSMKSLDNLILTEGKGAGMKRKLTHPGVEAAAALAQKYIAEE
jgi:hypothetical protein